MIRTLRGNNRGGVSDRVFEQMKQAIIDQEWKTGVRLPSEQALCEKFGVSRVTIRNALQRLGAIGLTETFLGNGTYVKQPDVGTNINTLIPVVYLEYDFESILEFRKVVESGACALAAQNATSKDVATLSHLLEKMLTLQGDLEALAMADLEFHYTIAQISGNKLFLKTYEIIGDVYTRHMKRLVEAMGGDLGIYYHKKIVQAIERRDPEASRKAMYEHIHKNMEFILTGSAKIPS